MSSSAAEAAEVVRWNGTRNNNMSRRRTAVVAIGPATRVLNGYVISSFLRTVFTYRIILYTPFRCGTGAGGAPEMLGLQKRELQINL